MAEPFILFQRCAGVDVSVLPGQLEVLLEQLAQAIVSGDDAVRLSLMGWGGELYCLPGDYQVAIFLLEGAVAQGQHLGEQRLEMVNCIRLARACQYTGRHDEAERLFRRALNLARNPVQADWLGFALQHLGTCLVEMGRFDEATSCFEGR